jgi:hypothetical protein
LPKCPMVERRLLPPVIVVRRATTSPDLVRGTPRVRVGETCADLVLDGSALLLVLLEAAEEEVVLPVAAVRPTPEWDRRIWVVLGTPEALRLMVLR